MKLILLFLLGACLGAVVNLCVYRLAYFRRRISPWGFTRGQFPARGWLDRVPILGWIGLRREENIHGKHFWVRPLAIELAFGLIAAGLYWFEVTRHGLVSPPLPMLIRQLPAATTEILCAQVVVHVLLLVLMAIATFIDIDEQTVPDAVTVPGTILALLIATLCPATTLPAIWMNAAKPQWLDLVIPLRFDYGDPPGNGEGLERVVALFVALAIYLIWCFALLPRRWRLGVGPLKAWRVMWRRIGAGKDWKWILPLAIAGSIGIAIVWNIGGTARHGLFSSLVGLAVGGGMIWAVRLLGWPLLRQEVMGFGDVTLMAMIGAFIGWQPAVIVFFLAPLAGAIIGGWQYLTRGDNVIPYGPYLCLATTLVIVFWAHVWDNMRMYFEIPWLIPGAILVCLPLAVVLLMGLRQIRLRRGRA